MARPGDLPVAPTKEPVLRSSGGKDAGNAREVVSDFDGGPSSVFGKKRENEVECAETDFADEDSAGAQELRRLRNERRVNFRAVRAAKKRGVRLVLADFALESGRVGAGDVGRIADDEIEGT